MPRGKLIQYRRGDASVWTSVNPVLAEGEAGYETDTKKIKVGDGVSAWADLAYISEWGSGGGGGGGHSWGEITGTISEQEDLQSAFDAKADLSDAFSGDYNDLTNTPTIPTNTNQLTNGAGFITGYTVTEGDVTTHEGALTITESQISDLGSYLTEAPLGVESYARRNGEWIEIPRFLTYIKTADTTRTSDATYTNDPDLVSEELVANAFYRVELLLMTKSDTATDLRFRVARTGLSDADLRLAGDLDNASSATITWNTAQNIAGAGVTTLRMGNYIGYLKTGDTLGNIAIQWGQQVSGVGTSTLALGSMLMLRRVS